MAILAGDVQVFKVDMKEYDGRKYFSCFGMTKEKDLYKFSASYEDNPQVGDNYQMVVSPSARDLKPFVRFMKVK